MFKRPEKPKIYRQTQARVQKLSTPEMLDWADRAGLYASRHLVEYSRHSSPDNLREAWDGAQILLAVIDVLRDRQEV